MNGVVAGPFDRCANVDVNVCGSSGAGVCVSVDVEEVEVVFKVECAARGQKAGHLDLEGGRFIGGVFSEAFRDAQAVGDERPSRDFADLDVLAALSDHKRIR